MAFQKFANASIIETGINYPTWDEVRQKAQALGSSFETREASRLALGEYQPKDYVLTHCSIIASVDTENGPGPLGRHLEGGFEVNRRFEDYYITPKTSQYVNSNGDCWDRQTLLGSFRTFIGSENYCEHIQIPELSKGKVIDAVARDLGDSVYVDILVATHRKNKPLIKAIASRELNTLSMGCNIAYSRCSKCGNVAHDATELCEHVKYHKLTYFYDATGKRRIVAELCGHHTDPGSVQFIEASWVANPAFKGAVVRSILTPEEVQKYAPGIQAALNQPTRVADPDLMARAARTSRMVSSFDFGQGEEEEFGGAGEAGGEGTKESDPLSEAVDDLATHIRNRALQKVRDEMREKGPPRSDLKENLNDTLIKEASQNPQWKRIALNLNRSLKDPRKTRRVLLGLLYHKHGGWSSVKAANTFSGSEVLAISRVLDTVQGVKKTAGEARIYRVVIAVGGTAPYGNEDVYLAACRRVLGRQPTDTERQSLVVKGKLFDLGS